MQTMAKQINADEESLLKRNARHRLIGAVALTTFVVVTLPLIFDNQPPPSFDSDIELRIPGEPILASNNGVSAPLAPTSVVTPIRSVELPVVETKPEATAVAAQVPMVEKVVVAEKEASPKGLAKPVAELMPEIKPKTDVEPAGVETVKLKNDKKTPVEEKSKAEADKPKAENKSRDVIKQPVANHAGFVLQLGAYANPASAKNLEAKLNKLGFHAYSEKTGNTIRVRISGYATRDAAEKARKKLAVQELHADIIHLN